MAFTSEFLLLNSDFFFSNMRQRLEYALAWLIIKILGGLPRPLARATAIALSWTIYLLHVRLRRVGMRNLALAFPDKTRRERARILCGVFTSLGRQLAEVCLFPKSPPPPLPPLAASPPSPHP